MTSETPDVAGREPPRVPCLRNLEQADLRAHLERPGVRLG